MVPDVKKIKIPFVSLFWTFNVTKDVSWRGVISKHAKVPPKVLLKVQFVLKMSKQRHSLEFPIQLSCAPPSSLVCSTAWYLAWTNSFSEIFLHYLLLNGSIEIHFWFNSCTSVGFVDIGLYDLQTVKGFFSNRYFSDSVTTDAGSLQSCCLLPLL